MSGDPRPLYCPLPTPRPPPRVRSYLTRAPAHGRTSISLNTTSKHVDPPAPRGLPDVLEVCLFLHEEAPVREPAEPHQPLAALSAFVVRGMVAGLASSPERTVLRTTSRSASLAASEREPLGSSRCAPGARNLPEPLVLHLMCVPARCRRRTRRRK